MALVGALIVLAIPAAIFATAFHLISVEVGLGVVASAAVLSGVAGFVSDYLQPEVTFKMQMIAEDDWQIAAEYPGAETRYIKGFKNQADVEDWLAGSRRIDWLRSQGYANRPT